MDAFIKQKFKVLLVVGQKTQRRQKNPEHQQRRINQLDEDEKNALIKIINSMLTKKRMKDLLDGKFKLGT